MMVKEYYLLENLTSITLFRFIIIPSFLPMLRQLLPTATYSQAEFLLSFIKIPFVVFYYKFPQFYHALRDLYRVLF